MGCISILRSSRYTVCPFPFLHVLVPLEMLSECRNCTIHCPRPSQPGCWAAWKLRLVTGVAAAGCSPAVRVTLILLLVTFLTNSRYPMIWMMNKRIYRNCCNHLRRRFLISTCHNLQHLSSTAEALHSAAGLQAAASNEYCHRLTGRGHVWDTWHVARESYITAGEDMYLNLALGRCPSVAAPPLPRVCRWRLLLLELRTINRWCFHNHRPSV